MLSMTLNSALVVFATGRTCRPGVASTVRVRAAPAKAAPAEAALAEAALAEAAPDKVAPDKAVRVPEAAARAATAALSNESTAKCQRRHVDTAN